MPALRVVEALLGPKVAAASARCAQAWRVGADEVVLSLGLVDEETFYRALARELDLPYVGPEDIVADPLALRGASLDAALATRLMPLAGEDALTVAHAPRGHVIGDLAAALGRDPALRERIRITSPRAIAQVLVGQSALVERATDHLRTRHPALSASERFQRSQERTLLLGAHGLTALMLWSVVALAVVVSALFSLIFLAGAWLRLSALRGRDGSAPEPPAVADEDLPTYTILVPLYREARVVPALVRALSALSYPRAKLDIKLLIEEDDAETAAAIRACALPGIFETVVLPDLGARTKPKALNVGLALARGRLVTVYDAEDRPEPLQLRRAAATFANDPGRLGCVQGRLAIDNADESWLSAQFAMDYEALFGRLLPTLARLGGSIPLGGTSNHFRIEALRAVGAWDPHNVTEDADLGIRLARFGWRADVLNSVTHEEAPISWRAWRRQRTRWFKGWLQTWLVHMRAPRALWRELGARGFLLFQVFVAGLLLSAFLHPLTMLWLGLAAAGVWETGWPASMPLQVLALVNIAALALGLAAAMMLSWSALADRQMKRLRRHVPSLPLYWVLQSVAAFAAFIEFLRDPFRWNKTEHGVTLLSRTGTVAPPSLVDRAAALRSRS